MTLTKIQGTSVLSPLGLTDVEIVVYNVMLGQAEYTSIRKIASISKLNRGVVYEALKKLVGYNLVSYNQKGGRRQYFAEKPNRIYDLIEMKKIELKKVDIAAQSLIPRLQAELKRQEGQPQVRFYEHDEGMVSILNDVLETVGKLPQKKYYAYSHQDIRPFLYRQFPGYTNKRIKLGIQADVIKIGNGEIRVDLDNVRRLQSDDTHKAKCYEIIYGNKVAMISVSTDMTPYGVVFEEAGIAMMHLVIFKSIWDSLQ